MSSSQETSMIAGTAAGVMSILALILIVFVCGYCSGKACGHEEEPQPDVELGNTQKNQDHSIWFARDSISEFRARQALDPPTLPDRAAGPGGPSGPKRSSTFMPVAIRDGHDAAVAEPLAPEFLFTGDGGPTMGDGTDPAEEQGNER
ncbi:hypothetical protein HOY80DRAFT_1139482 [Tuber brumale]|nr:hypothetical protein HOY80DRAFT_1139482 [Tuber brumale]